MKTLRQFFGSLAGLAIVLFLTLTMVACTFMLGFVPTAVRAVTQAEEQVFPPPTILQAELAANR